MSRVSRRENRTKAIQILILLVTVCISVYCVYLMDCNKRYEKKIERLQEDNATYYERIEEMEYEINNYEAILRELETGRVVYE